jgi:hypothetical protein
VLCHFPAVGQGSILVGLDGEPLDVMGRRD